MNDLWDAFQTDPQDNATFLGLFTVLSQTNELEQLVELYRTRASVSEPEEAIFLYLTLAEVWSQRLGMPGLAAEALFQAYEVDPRSPLLKALLREHLERHQDWTMLARLLDLEVRKAKEGEERGRALMEFGHFLREHLHDANEAARVFRKAADESEITLTASLIALQQLKAIKPSVEVNKQLSSLLGHSSNLESQLSIHDQAIAQLPEVSRDRRAEMMVQKARVVLEQSGDINRGMELLQEALQTYSGCLPSVRGLVEAIVVAVPGSTEGLGMLRDLALMQGEHEIFLDLLERELKLVQDEQHRFFLLMKLAEVQRDLAKAPNLAAKAAREAYDVSPSHAEHVLQFLEDLHRRWPDRPGVRDTRVELLELEQRFQQLVDLWEDLVATAREPHVRAQAAWKRARTLLHHIDDPKGAVAAYSTALEVAEGWFLEEIVDELLKLYDAGHLQRELLDLFRQLAQRTGRYSLLADLLMLRIERSSDPRDIARLYGELGDLARDELAKPKRAIESFEAAFRIDPDNIAYAQSLRQLYLEQGDTERARQWLEIELRESSDEGSVETLMERATLLEELGDSDTAILVFADVLEQDESHIDAQRAVRRYFQGPLGRNRLDPLSRVDPDRDPDKHARRLHALGNALSKNKIFAPRATELLVGAMRHGMTDPSFEIQLEQLLEGQKRHLDLAELWVRRIRRAPTKQARAATLSDLRKLAYDNPDNFKVQIRLKQLEIELEPSREKFDNLLALLEQEDDSSGLADFLDWALAESPWMQTASAEARIELLLRSATLELDKLGRPERASTRYAEVLELDRNHEPALDFFRQHYASDPAALYQRLAPSASAAEQPELRSARQAELARLSQHELGDSERAVFHWKQVLRTEGLTSNLLDEAADAVESILTEERRFDELEALYTSLIESASDDHAVAFAQKLVTLQREVLRKPEAARATLEKILERDPTQTTALASLINLVLDEGDFDHAARLLEALADACEGEDRRRHLSRLARLYRNEIGDWQRALAVYERILEHFPEHAKSLAEATMMLLGDEESEDEEDRTRALIDLYNQVIERAPEDEQLELMRARATLIDNHLEDINGAITAYREILERHPADLRSRLDLARVLESVGSWLEAIDVYAEHLHHDNDPQIQANLWLRIASARFEGLDNAEGAGHAYRQALEARPGDTMALEGLLVAAQAQGNPNALTNALGALLAHARTSQERVRYLYQLADIHQAQGELDAAARALESAFDEDSLDDQALVRLTPIYRELERYEELAEALGRRAGLAVEDSERQEALYEQALVLQNELNDPAAALRVHRKLIEMFPRFVPSLEQMVDLSQQLGLFEETVSVIESMMRAAPQRRFDLVLRAAEILEQQLERPEDAFAHYRWAHEIDAEAPLPLLKLYKLAETHNRWTELIEILEADAGQTDDPREQVRLFKEIAQISESQTGDLRRAFHILRFAQQIEPTDLTILAELERIAASGGFWQDLAVVYRAASERREDIEEQLSFLFRLAELTTQQLEDPQAAFDVLREALDADPHHPLTLERLHTLAEEEGLWHDYVEALEQRIESTQDPELELVIHREAAKIAVDRLGENELAAQHLVLALVCDPDDEALEAELAQRAQGRREPWLDFLDELKKEALRHHHTQLSPNQLRARSRILERYLDNLPGALDAVLATFSEEPIPEDLAARALDLSERLGSFDLLLTTLDTELGRTVERTRVIELLELKSTAAEKAGEDSLAAACLRKLLELNPSHQAAAARLDRMKGDPTRTAELLRMLEAQAARLNAPDEQADKHLEIARMLTQLGRLVDACDAYERVLKRRSSDLEARRELIDVSLRLERYTQAQRHLESLLPRTDSEDEAKALRMQLVQLHRQHLGQPDRAITVLRQILSAHPDDEEALSALSDVFTEESRWADLMALHEQRAEATSEPRKRREHLMTLAEIAATRLKNRPRALNALQRVDEAEGEDDPTLLQRIIDLYISMDRWEEAVDVEHRLVELEPDLEGRKERLWHILDLYEKKLHRLDRVYETLDTIAALDDTDPRPWLYQADVMRRRKHYEEAVESLQSAAERQSPEEAAGSWVAIGALLEKNNNVSAAVLAYERALELDPESRRALGAMAAASNDVEQLLNVLELDIQDAEDNAARARLFVDKARLLRDERDETLKAYELLEDAIALDPELHVATRDLADLAIELETWERASELLATLRADLKVSGLEPLPPERLLPYESPTDPERLVFLLRHALVLEQLDQHHEALSLYTTAREKHPDHVSVLLGLTRCYYRTGNWTRCRTMLEQLEDLELEIESEDEALLEFIAGDILYGSEQYDDALARFERALELDPECWPAANSKVATLIEQQRWEEALPGFELLLRLSHDDEERGAIFKRIGEVQDYFLNHPEEAILAYEQAMLLGGDTEDVPEQLLRLYVSSKHWEKAAVMTQALLEEQPPGSPARVSYMLILGDISGNGMGHYDHALALYRDALAAEPTNIMAVERIGTVLARSDDLRPMHAFYREYLEELPQHNTEVHVEVLRNYARQLVDVSDAPPAALQVLMALIRLSPEDIDAHQTMARLYAHPDLEDPDNELMHLRTLIQLGDIQIAHFTRILEIYSSRNRRDGEAELRNLLHTVGVSKEISGVEKPIGPGNAPSELETGSLSGRVYNTCILKDAVAGPLGHFFEMLGNFGVGELKQSVADLSEPPGKDITDSMHTPAVVIFHKLCNELGLGKRRLYLRSNTEVPLQIVATEVPSVILSEDILKTLFGRQLRFYLARTLEMTRPRFLLAFSMDAFELMTLVHTLIGELSSRPSHRKIPLLDSKTQKRARRHLAHLWRSQSIETMSELELVADQLQDPSEPLSLKRYVEAARATALRVGLLACNDQTAALKRILKEEHVLTLRRMRSFDEFVEAIHTSNDLQSLVQYILSDKYLLARSELGLARYNDTLDQDMLELQREETSLSRRPRERSVLITLPSRPGEAPRSLFDDEDTRPDAIESAPPSEPPRERRERTRSTELHATTRISKSAIDEAFARATEHSPEQPPAADELTAAAILSGGASDDVSSASLPPTRRSLIPGRRKSKEQGRDPASAAASILTASGLDKPPPPPAERPRPKTDLSTMATELNALIDGLSLSDELFDTDDSL